MIYNYVIYIYIYILYIFAFICIYMCLCTSFFKVTCFRTLNRSEQTEFILNFAEPNLFWRLLFARISPAPETGLYELLAPVTVSPSAPLLMPNDEQAWLLGGHVMICQGV